MPRAIEHRDNERSEANKMWRVLKLQNYFVDMLSSDELLDALYVEWTGTDGPLRDYEPAIHKAYRTVLDMKGIYTPDGTIEILIPEPEGDHDCAYLEEFVLAALKPERRGSRIRHKRSSKRLLVILGGIGEGKTSLLDYFFRRVVKNRRNLKNVVRLNVDFEEMADLLPSELDVDYLSNLLVEGINTQFPELREEKDSLLGVLEEPLKVHAGLLAAVGEKAGQAARDRLEAKLIERCVENPRVLIASTINYLFRVRKKRLVVTLDNVDRLPVECQSRAVNSVRLALRQWDCCAIVCVREYTYGNLWLMSEWGFERPLLYHKRAPRFASVLRRRFEKFDIGRHTQMPSFELGGKPLKVAAIRRFVKNISKFLWERDLEGCLFRLTNGNVRQMLNMVKSFLSFYRLDMEALFTSTFLREPLEAEKLRLTANFENFLSAIIVGNFRYYSASNPMTPEARETFVLNVVGGPPSLPLLPYRVLTYLRNLEIMNIEPLVEKASCMGATSSQVDGVLDGFLKSYVIESMQGVDIGRVGEIAITRKGEYYFDELVLFSTYIANVMNDAVWDREIQPYEQLGSLNEMWDFVVECVKRIYQIELEELTTVDPQMRGAYKDFLWKQPYCERLCACNLARLHKMKRRGAIISDSIHSELQRLLSKIHNSKKRGALIVNGR